MKKFLSVLLVLCLAAGAMGCDWKIGKEDSKEEPAVESAANESTAGESKAGSADFGDLKIKCEEGTDECWTLEGSTLTFAGLTANTVVSISGNFDGAIVVDAGDDFEFELELRGARLSCGTQSPITVLSGDKFTLTAKKDTENYIYDTRDAVPEDDENAYSAAVYVKCDMTLGGKGSLTVESSHNNGIHTKDDLKVKNLTLTVTCEDNALKGNDSVEIESGILTLIARTGDGIKTSSSDVSKKGKQRGTVTITGGTITVYAACDGIDAAYNVDISGDPVITVGTDRYSPYSETVTPKADEEPARYIRFTSKELNYSVKYINSDGDSVWVNAVYTKSVNAGRTTYYYYAVDTVPGYNTVEIYLYYSDQTQGQDEEYAACSDAMAWNSGYDTFALDSRNNSLYYSWANMGSENDIGGFGGWDGGPGGPGGMQEGNSDKGDYSTKGLKADNEILIAGGTVTIDAYDDAIHTNNDNELENGEAPTGNILISGGTVTLLSHDDGIHADGTLTIDGGSITVTSSYEGLEGTYIVISGGDISVTSSDDGMNATTTSGTGIRFTGGHTYVYAGGDGLDSNSRSSYEGIVFDGGDVIIISTSGGNSSIDTESGYAYNGGSVLALSPSGGMSSEATKCRNFSSVGTKSSMSLTSGQTLTVTVGGEEATSVKMPCKLNALVIYLGSSKAEFEKK